MLKAMFVLLILPLLIIGLSLFLYFLSGKKGPGGK
jgi:hypothetical protein